MRMRPGRKQGGTTPDTPTRKSAKLQVAVDSPYEEEDKVLGGFKRLNNDATSHTEPMPVDNRCSILDPHETLAKPTNTFEIQLPATVEEMQDAFLTVVLYEADEHKEIDIREMFAPSPSSGSTEGDESGGNPTRRNSGEYIAKSMRSTPNRVLRSLQKIERAVGDTIHEIESKVEHAVIPNLLHHAKHAVGAEGRDSIDDSGIIGQVTLPIGNGRLQNVSQKEWSYPLKLQSHGHFKSGLGEVGLKLSLRNSEGEELTRKGNEGEGTRAPFLVVLMKMLSNCAKVEQLGAQLLARLVRYANPMVVSQQLLGGKLLLTNYTALTASEAAAALGICVRRTEWEYLNELKFVNKTFDVALLQYVKRGQLPLGIKETLNHDIFIKMAKHALSLVGHARTKEGAPIEQEEDTGTSGRSPLDLKAVAKLLKGVNSYVQKYGDMYKRLAGHNDNVDLVEVLKKTQSGVQLQQGVHKVLEVLVETCEAAISRQRLNDAQHERMNKWIESMRKFCVELERIVQWMVVYSASIDQALCNQALVDIVFSLKLLCFFKGRPEYGKTPVRLLVEKMMEQLAACTSADKIHGTCPNRKPVAEHAEAIYKTLSSSQESLIIPVEIVYLTSNADLFANFWSTIEQVASRYHTHGQAWLATATKKRFEKETKEADEKEKKLSFKEKVNRKLANLKEATKEKAELVVERVKGIFCETEPGPDHDGAEVEKEEEEEEGAKKAKKKARTSVINFYDDNMETADQQLILPHTSVWLERPSGDPSESFEIFNPDGGRYLPDVNPANLIHFMHRPLQRARLYHLLFTAQCVAVHRKKEGRATNRIDRRGSIGDTETKVVEGQIKDFDAYIFSDLFRETIVPQIETKALIKGNRFKLRKNKICCTRKKGVEGDGAVTSASGADGTKDETAGGSSDESPSDEDEDHSRCDIVCQSSEMVFKASEVLKQHESDPFTKKERFRSLRQQFDELHGCFKRENNIIADLICSVMALIIFGTIWRAAELRDELKIIDASEMQEADTKGPKANDVSNREWKRFMIVKTFVELLDDASRIWMDESGNLGLSFWCTRQYLFIAVALPTIFVFVVCPWIKAMDSGYHWILTYMVRFYTIGWVIPTLASIYLLVADSKDYSNQPERARLRLSPASKYSSNFIAMFSMCVEMTQMNSLNFNSEVPWDEDYPVPEAADAVMLDFKALGIGDDTFAVSIITAKAIMGFTFLVFWVWLLKARNKFKAFESVNIAISFTLPNLLCGPLYMIFTQFFFTFMACYSPDDEYTANTNITQTFLWADNSISCYTEEHAPLLLIGLMGVGLFTPIACLSYGMNQVLFPQEDEDIQYAPIVLMVTNVVKTAMTYSMTVFPWKQTWFIIVGALGNTVVMGLLLLVKGCSLWFIKAIKIAVYLSCIFCALCALGTIYYPRLEPIKFLHIGWGVIWIILISYIIIKVRLRRKKGSKGSRGGQRFLCCKKKGDGQLDVLALKSVGDTAFDGDAAHEAERRVLLQLLTPLDQRANSRAIVGMDTKLSAHEVFLVFQRLYSSGCISEEDVELMMAAEIIPDEQTKKGPSATRSWRQTKAERESGAETAAAELRRLLASCVDMVEVRNAAGELVKRTQLAFDVEALPAGAPQTYGGDVRIVYSHAYEKKYMSLACAPKSGTAKLQKYMPTTNTPQSSLRGVLLGLGKRPSILEV
jgi:hypothetical protein